MASLMNLRKQTHAWGKLNCKKKLQLRAYLLGNGRIDEWPLLSIRVLLHKSRAVRCQGRARIPQLLNPILRISIFVLETSLHLFRIEYKQWQKTVHLVETKTGKTQTHLKKENYIDVQMSSTSFCLRLWLASSRPRLARNALVYTCS